MTLLVFRTPPGYAVTVGHPRADGVGPAGTDRCLKMWRAHIGFFVNYTLGVATHNPAKAAAANKNLAGYTTQFSQFIAGVTKLSPAPATRSGGRPPNSPRPAGQCVTSQLPVPRRCARHDIGASARHPAKRR
jgi:hypothetical protein